MRWTVLAAMVLVACGGKDETTTDDGGCDAVDVVITVTDSAGTPVEEATVEVGPNTCDEGDPGVYSCLVAPDEYVMSVVKSPDFNPYAETITLADGICEYPVAVTLPPPLVY